jgi:hypothetical protein
MTATTVIDWSLCPVLESVPEKMSGAWVATRFELPHIRARPDGPTVCWFRQPKRRDLKYW